MDFIKAFRWNGAAFSAASVGLGAVFLLRPALGGPTVYYLLAALLLLGFAGRFISYASSRRQGLPVRTDLAVGLLLGLSAALTAFGAQRAAEWIPTVMGGVLSVNGAVKLQKSLQLKQVQYRGWAVVLVCALLTVGFGVILLFDPFAVREVTVRVLGTGLLFSGLSDLTTMASVSRQVRKDKLSGVRRFEDGAS